MPLPLIALERLGWDSSWSEAASAYRDRARPGRVIRVDRGVCTVLTRTGPVRATLGGEVLDAMAADAADAPTTGDWCLLRSWSDGPVTIEVLLPRRAAVVRADAAGTSRGQVLAANIDLAAVVVGLVPDPNLRRVERLVTLAWQSGAQPLVVMTKADLVGDADQVADDVRAVAPGVEVVVCSTVTGVGIDRLRGLVGNHGTLALLGASGHGKSSLTNALHGTHVVTALGIRTDGKGRHTSVRRELVPLPSGGCVIDTPGLRAVGLQEEGGLAAAFPDIEELAANCRFRDCKHQSEPGCAVLEAVEAGELAVRRLESWRALEREIAWMATRADARLRAAQVAKWKQRTKEQRARRKSEP
ncbi:MAG: ribosome small subunit-dependent GTPase A [Nocardioidaceae bacterium]